MRNRMVGTLNFLFGKKERCLGSQLPTRRLCHKQAVKAKVVLTADALPAE